MIDFAEGWLELGPRAGADGDAVPGAPAGGISPDSIAHAPREHDGGGGVEGLSRILAWRDVDQVDAAKVVGVSDGVGARDVGDSGDGCGEGGGGSGAKFEKVF